MAGEREKEFLLHTENIREKLSAVIGSVDDSFDWDREGGMRSCFILREGSGGEMYEEGISDTIKRLRSQGDEAYVRGALAALAAEGNFFLTKEGTDRPFSVGPSQDDPSRLALYPPGTAYSPGEPQPLPWYKKFLNFFGLFSDEAAAYSEQKASFAACRDKQEKYRQHFEKTAKSRAAAAEYREKVNELDQAVAARAQEFERLRNIPDEQKTPEEKLFFASYPKGSAGGAPANLNEKVKLLSETDPQRIAVRAMFGRLWGKKLSTTSGSFDLTNLSRFFGDMKMLAEVIPCPNASSAQETGDMLGAVIHLNRAEIGVGTLSEQDIERLTKLCRTNAEQLNGGLEAAGISDDAGLQEKNALFVSAKIAGGELGIKAEMTARIAKRLQECLPADSPRRIGLLALRFRSEAISLFFSQCWNADGSTPVPAIRDSISYCERRAAASDPDKCGILFDRGRESEQAAYREARADLKDIRPMTPYQRLQKESGALSGEEAQLLAAQIIVGVMKKDLPGGANPGEVARKLAKRQDFQIMIGSDPANILKMAADGELISKTSALYAGALQKDTAQGARSEPQTLKVPQKSEPAASR